MSNRLAVILLAIVPFLLPAQISVKTTIPSEIKANSELVFEAKIWKGPIKNFSKYQLELPEGISVSEVEIKSASFNVEQNLVKIIWAITPSDDEYTITLKLSCGAGLGEKTIHQKYTYLEKGEKKELELASVNFRVVDSLGRTEAQAVTDKPAETKETTEPNLNTEDLNQQVAQLRKDSREAREVGEKEKSIAQAKLKEANEAVVKARALSNENQKKIALEKAMIAKDKAESDLAMANRILTLAQSLDENANEIEKLSQSLSSAEGTGDSQKKTDEKQGAAPPAKTETPAKPGEKDKTQLVNKGVKDGKGLYKPIKPNSGNIHEIIQQVEQIKKDSREAQDVGQREKRKAEQKLSEAYETLKKAEYISDAEEKRLTIEKANKDKDKAERDLEVASKILGLAKSLSDNAVEIENLHNLEEERKKMETAKTTPSVSPSNTVASGSPTRSTSAKEDAQSLVDLFDEKKDGGEVKRKDVKPEKPGKRPDTIVKTTKETKENNAPISGTVYRLQVGSFVKAPDKTQFVSIGKVDVYKEEEKYRAYYGNFASREEANAKRDQLKGKGIDAFVVVFNNGQKVK